MEKARAALSAKSLCLICMGGIFQKFGGLFDPGEVAAFLDESLARRLAGGAHRVLNGFAHRVLAAPSGATVDRPVPRWSGVMTRKAAATSNAVQEREQVRKIIGLRIPHAQVAAFRANYRAATGHVRRHRLHVFRVHFVMRGADRQRADLDLMQAVPALPILQVAGHDELALSIASLAPRWRADTLLVTDANKACRAFAEEAGVAHDFVNVSAGQRITWQASGAIHVQNVNGYPSRFHGWLHGFRGVATRY